MAVFSAWRAPLKVHLGIFVFLYALSFAKFQVILIIRMILQTLMTLIFIFLYALTFDDNIDEIDMDDLIT